MFGARVFHGTGFWWFRFGVSGWGFRERHFAVRGFGHGVSLFGVFKVRDVAVRGFACSRFRVRGFGLGFSMFEVSGRGFLGSGFRYRCFGYGVTVSWFRDPGFL